MTLQKGVIVNIDLSTSPSITALYFGDANTDGSWRILPVGNNLSIQRRESGSWVEKDAMTP